MKSNRKLFIGLLALSAFLGACITFGSKTTMVKDIPPSWFEENRGEGERLVYVTVERATELKRGVADAELYIVTDNAAIQNLKAPANKVSTMGYAIGFHVQDSIRINNHGLAVFSLPKSQDTIGLAYLCDADTRSEEYYEELAAKGVITKIAEVIYTNGHVNYKIDPDAGDIAIKVSIRPNEAFRAQTSGTTLKETPSDEGTFRIQTTTSNDAIKQMVAGCSQYGTPFTGAKSTPGFIAPPAKE